MDYRTLRNDIMAPEIPDSDIIQRIERLPDRSYLNFLLSNAVGWNRLDVVLYLIDGKGVSADTISGDTNMLELALLQDQGTGKYRRLIGELVQRCGPATVQHRINMGDNHTLNGANVLMLTIMTKQPIQVIRDILDKTMQVPGPTSLIDAQNDKGRTALHYAAGTNNLEAVNLLLERGANIRLKDRGNNAAYHLTTSNLIKERLGLPPDPTGTPPRRSATVLAAAAESAGSPPGPVAPPSPERDLDPKGGRRRTRRKRSKRKSRRHRRS